MKRKAYAIAGVDRDLGHRLKRTLPGLLSGTRRPEVLGEVGGFAGLFAFDKKKFREPVLVASTDGVGTKLKIAVAMNRHDAVAQDLVSHCVNDISVLGAEPLFFLDYISSSQLAPAVFAALLRGFVRACRQNRCALLGGEMAQMPGFYRKGDYDLCGTMVGVVEKAKIIDGRNIQPGDVMIGLASNGLHTNGYALAQKTFFGKLGLKPGSYVRELKSTLGAELLRPHRNYGILIRQMLRRFNAGRTAIKGLAHITGGGLVDNLPRLLPVKCDAKVRKTAWTPPPIFQLLKEKSGASESELYQVFNMGIGLVAVVREEQSDTILRFIRANKQKAWMMGEIVSGKGQVRFS